MYEKFPRIPHTQETKKRAEDVIGWLGLSFNDLRKKVVLDVGADAGEVAAEGNRRGCTIISLDRLPEGVLWGNGIQENIPYTVGDARLLPFADSTFDYVLSHAAPPTTWTETPELVARTLEEYVRVVKPGGEVRFGSGYHIIGKEAVEHLQTWWEKLLSQTPIIGHDVYEHTRKKHSLAFLRSLHPEIVRVTPKNPKSETQGYCIIKKPAL